MTRAILVFEIIYCFNFCLLIKHEAGIVYNHTGKTHDVNIFFLFSEFGGIDTALIRRSKSVVVRGPDWQSCHEYTANCCVVIVLL